MSGTCPTCGATMEGETCPRCVSYSRRAAAAPEGTPFGRYILQSELGRGGMGVVYRAWDTELRRAVALKTLLRDEAEDPTATRTPEATPTMPATPAATPEALPQAMPPGLSSTVQRFLREARAAARLRHPNVIEVYDVGQHEGRFFFTMELVEGVGLERWLRGEGRKGRGRPSFREVASVIEGAARGLAAAHAEGVVHRDVKPANILVDAGDKAHLGDFGLARDVQASTTAALTLAGALLGTPTFMSPEQAGGAAEAIGPASDTFSLGSVLYFSLTGRVPFEGSTLLVLLQAILGEEPTRPSKVVPSIPRDLEVVCLKAMEKEPRHRYRSAAELADDLGRFSRGEQVLARAPGLLSRTGRLVRRRIGWISAVAAFLAICGVAGLAMHWSKGASAASAQQRKREAAENLLSSAAVEGTRDRAGLRALLPRIQAAIDADPTFADAWLRLGRTKERLGDLDGAIAAYAQARTLDPMLAEAHYREGCVLLWKTTGPEWDQATISARKAFRRAGEAQKGSAYATLGEAYLVAFERDRKAAFELVQKVIESGERHPDAYFLRGALRSYDFTRGGFDFGKSDDALIDMEAAEADLTRGLEIDPLCSWALASRGGVRFTLGNLDASRADFVASLTLSPERPSVNYMAARVALALDLYDDCRRYISAALAQSADDKEYIIRAMLGVNTFNYLGAREDMDAAIDLGRKSVQNRIFRAILRRITGDEAGAREDIACVRSLGQADMAPAYRIDRQLSTSDPVMQVMMRSFEDFDRIFVLPPARKKTLRDAQRLLGGLGWYKEALGKLSADPTSTSEVTSLLFGFGQFMEERPSLAEAITFVMQGLELKSRVFRPEGMRWLAKMLEETNLLRRKRLYQAKEYLRRAGAYYRAERFADALADLTEAERLSPGDADVQYALATVRARTGDAAGSLSALSRAFRAGWGHPEYTREDDDFVSLRGREEFQRLVQ